MNIKWQGENRFKDVDSDTYWNFAWDVSRNDAVNSIIDHIGRWKKAGESMESYFGRHHFIPRSRKLTPSELLEISRKQKLGKT